MINTVLQKYGDEFLESSNTFVAENLSHYNRIKIKKPLQPGTMFVCENRAVLEIYQICLSKHLRRLDNDCLVKAYKKGTWVKCYFGKGASSPNSASILGSLKIESDYVNYFTEEQTGLSHAQGTVFPKGSVEGENSKDLQKA